MEKAPSITDKIRDVLIEYFDAEGPEGGEAAEEILEAIKKNLKVHVLIAILGGIVNEVGVYTDREKARARAIELAEHYYDCEKGLGEDYWRDEEDHFFATDAEMENEVKVKYDLNLDQKYD